MSLSGSHILQGVDLLVESGGVTALLGRNGVGKTTTLRALMGLVPRTGHVEILGHDADGLATHRVVHLGVGYVPEDRDVFAGLTVAENLRLAEQRREPDYDQVFALFPELKDRRRQRAGTLSGGQQQMLSIGRVLLNRWPLLLVDEPSKGLAPKIVSELADTLGRVASVSTILLVEQNLALVRRLATHVVVLDHGIVVHQGPASDLDDAALTRRHLGVAGAR
ncbi:MAG TPA: ABC transporter ATP-binding protein [Acidimicrobiales bacterium]|nr:ABC transporter ATP-binding protein [Acidimicrobiales bacterium]